MYDCSGLVSFPTLIYLLSWRLLNITTQISTAGSTESILEAIYCVCSRCGNGFLQDHCNHVMILTGEIKLPQGLWHQDKLWGTSIPSNIISSAS